MKYAVSLLLLFCGVLTAQPSGTFGLTGKMTVPRIGHTATLLQSGKVLICGGGSEQSSLATVWPSAELYDPVTGTFAATGNMTRPRWYHTATLLPDGKVLIAGGTASNNANGVSVERSAELYDPDSGAFTATADMTTARMFHSATLLNDGRVLIAGGLGIFVGVNGFLASSEVYDPVAGAFTRAGDMTHQRIGPTAALLPNGKVLVAAGHGSDDGPIPDIEAYDPASSAFSVAGAAGSWATIGPAIVSVLPNGRVLVNMTLYDSPTTAAQLYDPVSMNLTPTGNMTATRTFTSTLLSTGTVLTAGRALDSSLASADVYDPAMGVFSPAGDMITPRTGHTATLLSDGTVLLAGGITSLTWRALSTAELYRPAQVAPAPRLYSLAGTAAGAILHAGTNRVVSRNDPAVVGEALEIYGAGLLDGSVIPPHVTIGGRMAEVLFFGNAPGYAGLSQINVRVPGGVAPGPAVPVRLTYLTRPSNEVAIEVR
jgi:galactose oxidase-like protein